MNKSSLIIILSGLIPSLMYSATQIEPIAATPVVRAVLALNQDYSTIIRHIQECDGKILTTFPVFRIDDDNIRYSFTSGKTTSLFHINEKFFIRENNQLVAIPNHAIGQELRNLDNQGLNNLLQNGTICITQRLNGEYVLQFQPQLKGGGILGANLGFWAGKFVTHFVGHSIICVVSAATGPFAPKTFAALELTFAPEIEAASNVVGLGCGILGGTTTGPV